MTALHRPGPRVPDVFEIASGRYYELQSVASVTGAPFADVFTAFWDGTLDPTAPRGDPGERHWVSEPAMDEWFRRATVGKKTPGK